MIPKFRAWDKSINFMDDRVRITTIDNNVKVEVLDAFTHWRELEEEQYELMQSTGLKDKNRVEVFEGDIMTTIGGMLYKVTKSVSGLWKLIPIEKYDDVYYLTLADVADLMMIIGNIHENPELLEGK